jgi:hypothetical protein
MPRNRRVSCFDATRMPADSIRKRELHAFSVHYSVATSKWIATLVRPNSDCSHSDDKRRCVSFPFAAERDARKFGLHYSPPKHQTNATLCVCCNIPFSDESKYRAFNCRNCGSQVCDKCSTRWGIRMIPKTYLCNQNSAMTVRVCKSCDWLSNAFCMALLRGSYHDATRFNATGNVNLRCTFADISREAMYVIICSEKGKPLWILVLSILIFVLLFFSVSFRFPIHCAVSKELLLSCFLLSACSKPRSHNTLLLHTDWFSGHGRKRRAGQVACGKRGLPSFCAPRPKVRDVLFGSNFGSTHPH